MVDKGLCENCDHDLALHTLIPQIPCLQLTG